MNIDPGCLVERDRYLVGRPDDERSVFEER
jgi:hypothetical protein